MKLIKRDNVKNERSAYNITGVSGEYFVAAEFVNAGPIV
jgi:hypothetical protein